MEGGDNCLARRRGQRNERERTEKDRDHSLPFSSTMVAGKLPSASGFRDLNITLPLFLKCLSVEEFIKGHFRFFRKYCNCKKSPTSDEISPPNQLAEYLLGLVHLP